MTILTIFGCVALVGVIVFMSLPTHDNASRRASNASPLDALPSTENITIRSESFQLELAIDNTARARGLGGRNSIPRDGGMLFIFPRPAFQSFLMKGCTTDIDLIFLDSEGRVTALHEMPVEPPQRPEESEFAYESRLPGYRSDGLAQFAIELAPGSIKRLGVQVGEQIELDLPRLKTLPR